MEIVKVMYSNLDSFKDAVNWLDRQEYSKNNVRFERNVRKLLNHSSISLVLDKVSLLECYMLKLFTGNIIIIKETYIDDETYNVDEELRNSVAELEKLTDVITSDEAISELIGHHLYPVGSVENKILITFDGNSICSVLSQIPDKFIHECIENNVNLDDEIIRNFITNFYNFMSSSLDYTDLATDLFIKRKYYDQVDYNSINISHVNLYNSQINFSGITADVQRNQVLECRNFIRDIGLSDEDILRNTYLYFIVDCSFCTFLELAINLPLSVINDHSDFKLMLNEINDGMLLPDSYKNYYIRIMNRLKGFSEVRLPYIGKKENQLKKHMLIPGIQHMQCTIKVSYDEINKYIIPYKKKVLSGLYKMDDNRITTLEKDILNILNTISDISVTTYKTIASGINS